NILTKLSYKTMIMNSKPQGAHPFSIIIMKRESKQDKSKNALKVLQSKARFPRYLKATGISGRGTGQARCVINTRLVCRQSTLFKDPQVVDQAKWAGPSSVVFTLNHECTKHGEILIKLIKIKGKITYQTKHGTTSKRHNTYASQA
ncbi:hypothetical protein, partial [Streptomyces plicatus]|uniref:hypothetical protein n=1 Tax=Streptomyces plicatus TaxID=1922 RepID=UPI001C705C44